MNPTTVISEVSPNSPTSQRGWRDILRFFSPRWFIAIMGTGALANIVQMLSGQATGARHWAAVSLLALACLAFPLALALMASRLWIDRRMLVKELEHSSLVQFYSAIFIAAAVCATGLVKIPLPLDSEVSLVLAKGFWSFSLILGLVLAFFTPWRIITQDHGELRRVLGFWFLPPVGLFVLVFAGNFLAVRLAEPAWLDGMALLNAILLGVALFQSALMFALFFLRALAFPFPRPDIVPSFVIGLAPVGVSIIALLSYLPLLQQVSGIQFVNAAQLAPLIKVLALLLWGFGLWWLVVVTGIVLTAVARKPLPVTLGFWAFVFPPAAYTIATLMLGQVTGLSLLTNLGQILANLVALAWLAVAFATIRGVLNGRIFNLPASFAEILQDAPGPNQNGARGAITLTQFKGKYPIFTATIPKREHLSDTPRLALLLKQKIQEHPVARFIAEFDHLAHTRGLGGTVPTGLRGAVSLVFCFGPSIEEARVLSIRPRSLGIAEFENHFAISFMEAPSDNANQAMKAWIQSI